MKKKVTIYDVSRQLGISTATVNRALSGKPNVSEHTRQLVKSAVEEMGYKPSRTASSLSRTPVSIGVIVSCTIPGFFEEIIRGAKQSLTDFYDFNLRGEILVLPENYSHDVYSAKIEEFTRDHYDGVVILPHTDVHNTRLIIDNMHKRGIKVVTITSDIMDSPRILSVRNNGRYAGRMAAEYLSCIVEPGLPVTLVTGCRDAIVHAETINGFIEYSKICALNFVGVYEHRDDPEIGYHIASKVMKDYPRLGGIYFSSANSVTFCKRLHELGKADQLKIVASDVFPDMVNMIQDRSVDATIFQHPFEQGRLSVQYLFEHLAEGRQFENDTVLLDPQLVLRSNLDLYTGNAHR